MNNGDVPVASRKIVLKKTHVSLSEGKKPAIALERELSQLRNSGRLAIHINEALSSPLQFANSTWDKFKTDKALLAEGAARSFDDHSTVPLVSISTLPSGDDSIKPYGVNPDGEIDAYGYLINLNQAQAYRPVILGASNANMDSSHDPYEKRFWSATRELLPHYLKEFYDDQHKWVAASCDAKSGVDLGNVILDTLADAYKKSLFYDDPSFPKTYNELVVAATKEHVKAITIPVNEKLLQIESLLEVQKAKLTGALVGLDHLQQKPPVDLPVVFYYMIGSDKVKRGAIKYIGQGKEELLDIAFRAMAEIQSKDPNCKKIGPTLLNTISKFGLDLKVPLEDQNAAITELKNHFAAIGNGMDIHKR